MNDQILFTARCARDAENAERIFFSFAVERTAKENYSAASLHKKYLAISLIMKNDIAVSHWREVLAFRRLSGKLKNITLCVLCASAVSKFFNSLPA
jgi:hypothetical protein